MSDLNTRASKGVILLVDDTPSDVHQLSDFLTGKGFDVRFESSGRAAIQTAVNDPPEIILLDGKMPEMDGYEVCQRLKAVGDLKSIPVLFIGVLDETMDKVKGFDVGGADYITKPFEFMEVLARVEAHLTNARMKIQLELATRELDAARRPSERLHANLEGQVQRRTAELEDANKALSEIKAQFEAVYNHHYQLTGLIDKKGRLLMGNRTALEFAGVEAEDVVGKRFWETPWWTHSQEAQRMLREAMERAMRGEMVNFESTHISVAGETRNIDFRIRPVFDDDGEVIYLVPEGYDITERKQAEEALRKYEHIVSSTSDLVSFIDRNYVYQAVNEAYLKAHQKEYADIVGHSIVDLHGRKVFNEVIKNEIDRCLAGEEIRYQEWFEYPGIGQRFMDVIYAPYVDASGETSGVVVNVRDITERKFMEEALRESEEKYRLLVENANEAIFIIQDGIIKFPNFKTEEMTGYSEKELSEIPFVNIIHSDDREMVLERRRKRLLGENPPSTYSFRIINKSGGELLVQINTVFTTWEGKPATINFIRDITEQKRLEDQLHQAQKMESLGLLAGGVAHDLNNVLSGIVSYPELLLLDLPEDSKLRKPIEEMQESGLRAAAIVQDLLTVARGVAITKEPLNLNDLVFNYLNSPEFEKLKKFHPAVTIKANLDPDLINIIGSHIHIRKVIMNLVSNASEAIDGSGHVIISTMNRYIDRPLKGYDDVKIGEYAVLAVSDDGSGISSSELERIFDPFYTKKVLGRSGTGLGLAVVWNIMQDHKGYIDVKSDENGTIFELYFSITRDEISDKTLSISIKDYKGKGERILVVDDLESQQEILCNMLDTLGYKTQAVSSGEEAVEYLKENTVDLILLDMIMDPGINGRETYERIIKIHPKQKAIIVSGFAETDDVKEIQKLGAGQYIKKPLTLEKIGIAVRDELKK